MADDPATSGQSWFRRAVPLNSFAVDHTRAWTGMWGHLLWRRGDRHRRDLWGDQGLRGPKQRRVDGLDPDQCLHRNRHDDDGLFRYPGRLQHCPARHRNAVQDGFQYVDRHDAGSHVDLSGPTGPTGPTGCRAGSTRHGPQSSGCPLTRPNDSFLVMPRADWRPSVSSMMRVVLPASDSSATRVR